jgi:hypothetical protein
MGQALGLAHSLCVHVLLPLLAASIICTAGLMVVAHVLPEAKSAVQPIRWGHAESVVEGFVKPGYESVRLTPVTHAVISLCNRLEMCFAA